TDEKSLLRRTLHLHREGIMKTIFRKALCQGVCARRGHEGCRKGQAWRKASKGLREGTVKAVEREGVPV
ncbi:MAG: hypothetical protein JXA57_15880, partial [Armatimonadetes bacterium]|nr:hypothetical protein [Armatimonadota bacterium]